MGPSEGWPRGMPWGLICRVARKCVESAGKNSVSWLCLVLPRELGRRRRKQLPTASEVTGPITQSSKALDLECSMGVRSHTLLKKKKKRSLKSLYPHQAPEARKKGWEERRIWREGEVLRCVAAVQVNPQQHKIKPVTFQPGSRRGSQGRTRHRGPIYWSLTAVGQGRVIFL